MHHHRSSTKEKQPSKRNASKGRVETTRSSVKKLNTAALSKQDRLNTLKQLREVKKEEILHKKRFGADFDDRPLPPKVVCLVGFHTQADPLSLKRKILSLCGYSSDELARLPPHRPAVAALPNWAQGPGMGKPRVLLIDPPRTVFGVLDAAKCADVVLCVVGPHASLEEPAFDDLGYKTLTALKAQGLPVVLGAMHGSETVMDTSAKKQAEARKFVTRYFHSELGAETRLFAAGTDEEAKTMLRAVAASTPKELTWRAGRGYMLAQEIEYSPQEGTLSLKGYVRGPGFRCSHLAHLTGHGDFAVERISTLNDPCPIASGHSTDAMADAAAENVVDELGMRELDLERLQPYDPTMAEQTWPSIEELEAQKKDAASKPRHKSRGGGKIPAPGEAADVAGVAGDDDDEMGDEGDEEQMADEGSEDGASVAPSGMAGTEDHWDVSSNMTMEVPTSEVIAAEKRRREVLLQRSEEELEFPDEVDTPLEVPARERFQRYRGLKSFRTSSWDPYEDLPVEYSRIWEFEAFGSTARAARQSYIESCEEVSVAALYCCIRLRGVPPTVTDAQPQGVPFILSGLFDCEQKVSVVHGHVTRIKDYTEVMKSKDEVVMHAGFRRFSARPIYSEIPRKSSTNKKYKFMRFLHQEITACASFYAPVVFPPCRLLMSVQPEGAITPELAAAGSIVSVDPKQLIIKRIILTGYPFRTQKNKAVVRFMFFNPPDIRWFKPVELSTKKGLRGHIKESLGTHGYMKCRFSAHIKQDDTVCMNLYKRVYPKWHPPAWGGDANASPEEA